MSQIALYRKYRPDSFDKVIGQDHISGTLKEAIGKGSISHAYLFSGSRGTGKTSVARILAKEIGCNPEDLYEIDAASNRGIDDIRELRESVHVLPMRSPYKVYIIDEAHMLTRDAFNALLKTLEEPPSHVVFVLATTEMEKLPETVISRCQTFAFKKPSQKILKEMISNVAKAEGYTLESSAAELISLLGDGSFRDTHGILEKVISSSRNKKITNEQVEKVSGAPSKTIINDFIEAIDTKDSGRGLKTIAQASDKNMDFKIFLKLVLYKMRQIMLLRYAKDMEKDIQSEMTVDDFIFLKEISLKKETNINSNSLKEFLLAYDAVGRSIVPQLPIELALLEISQ